MSNPHVWHKTHCARMDHGGCALLLQVENNGRVKIKGDPEGSLNQGFICAKGRASLQKLQHPGRLRYPLKRKGSRGSGHWQRISWPEALDRISRNLERIRQEHGAREVAFCQGMPKGLEHFVLIRLANLFGSPNVVAVQDVCHAPREISGLHTCGFYPVPDYHHASQLILLWGSNPPSTNEEGAICTQILGQLKSGAKLLVVDPRRTELADRADLWLAPYPGTDGLLALGLLRVILEEGRYDLDFVRDWTHGFAELRTKVQQYSLQSVSETTGVATESIRRAARMYAEAQPAVLGWGNPLEHTVNAFATLRALICLMAVCGNLDRPGGNIQALDPPIASLGRFVRAELLPQKPRSMLHAHFKTIPRLMTVPPVFFKRAVQEQIPYAIRGAYIQCANPVMTWADSRSSLSALQKLDFLAVSDLVMTPTAAQADIVLPAAAQYEFDDIGHYGLGHGYILPRPKIIDPPEACRPDLDILNELGKRLTPDRFWFTDYRLHLEEVLKPSGLTFADFAEQGILKGPQPAQGYRTSGFRTPSGKVELCLQRADALGVAALPDWGGLPETKDSDYPLLLTSSKSPYYLHSSYRWIDALRKKEPDPIVRIHPETAAAFGIQNAQWVVIATPQGQIIQKAELSKRILPGVVHAAYGWWFPEEESHLFGWDRSNYNCLTHSDRIGTEFGTPNLKAVNCRISPCSQTGPGSD